MCGGANANSVYKIDSDCLSSIMNNGTSTPIYMASSTNKTSNEIINLV
jgi:hypothetical protein